MRNLKFGEWLLLTGALLLALFIGGAIRPAPGLRVHKDAPVVWTAAENTEYEYIARKANELFEPLYKGGPQYAGHAQYGSLYLVCTKGQPARPVDGSALEVWCAAWTWDGTEWVLRELYLWGTQKMYKNWKETQHE